MKDVIIISQAEIDYILTCMQYLNCYTVNREKLAERIMSLPAGRKRLQMWEVNE